MFFFFVSYTSEKQELTVLPVSPLVPLAPYQKKAFHFILSSQNTIAMDSSHLSLATECIQ